MKWSIAIAAFLPLLTSCGVDRGKQEVSEQAAAVVRLQEALSPDTYALGTSITEEGAVPQDAVVESVGRGGEVFLSVNVSGASTEQTVEVAWLDPEGRTLRRAARHPGRNARFVSFSSGPTGRWRSGVHRARVVIDGRTVNEKQFEVL